jgi:hypothetical protein
MCPMCVTTAALAAAAATSGIGVLGLIAAYWRSLRGWLLRHWTESNRGA